MRLHGFGQIPPFKELLITKELGLYFFLFFRNNKNYVLFYFLITEFFFQELAD